MMQAPNRDEATESFGDEADLEPDFDTDPDDELAYDQSRRRLAARRAPPLG
jgi:hypothetical protein